jgi:predicted nuclease with RNAse H fold
VRGRTRTEPGRPAGGRAVVGLDLAGSPLRRTGFCVIRRGQRVETAVLGGDPEILERTLRERPAVVAIDAPLSLPRGRARLDVPGPPHFRACDLELRRRGIRFFPLTLGPMRMLTQRGIQLMADLEARGIAVVESYPGAAQDLLGLPRKGAGVEVLRRALLGFGFRGTLEARGITHDELDAILCAWTGRLYLRGQALVIGDPDEGLMILPRPLARPIVGVRPRSRSPRSGPAGPAPSGQSPLRAPP